MNLFKPVRICSLRLGLVAPPADGQTFESQGGSQPVDPIVLRR